MRLAALLFALVAGACEVGAGAPDGGADAGAPRAPLRSCATELTFRGAAQSVAVGGEWNQFDPQKTPMVQSGGAWRVALELPPGSYAYKLVVDGNWQFDPANPYAKFVGGIENSVV